MPNIVLQIHLDACTQTTKYYTHLVYHYPAFGELNKFKVETLQNMYIVCISMTVNLKNVSFTKHSPYHSSLKEIVFIMTVLLNHVNLKIRKMKSALAHQF